MVIAFLLPGVNYWRILLLELTRNCFLGSVQPKVYCILSERVCELD